MQMKPSQKRGGAEGQCLLIFSLILLKVLRNQLRRTEVNMSVGLYQLSGIGKLRNSVIGGSNKQVNSKLTFLTVPKLFLIIVQVIWQKN